MESTKARTAEKHCALSHLTHSRGHNDNDHIYGHHNNGHKNHRRGYYHLRHHLANTARTYTQHGTTGRLRCGRKTYQDLDLELFQFIQLLVLFL